uniref:Muscular LMNA interacting protein n=1 Tax=Apteryx owenii TaxID=8824 RepID=A0A8B9QGC0_APTOW
MSSSIEYRSRKTLFQCNMEQTPLCHWFRLSIMRSCPLTFTFVPSIGRLPTHFEVVDVSKFLVRLPEEPKDLSCQEITYKSNTVSDELALKSGARQDSVHPVRTDSSQKIFQPPSCNSNRGEMQANDLFKAEFILITDSGEEDEVATASNSAQQAPNGYRPISARLLAASHVSAGGEAKKPPDDLHGSSATPSHSTTDQQKQQYKIKTSYKAFAAIPTNTLLMEQKVSVCLKTWKLHYVYETMCSPAQLRQQTEELCAVIDQVLQDPLPMVIHQYVRLTFYSSLFCSSLMNSVSRTLQRAAGCETRYVSTFIMPLSFVKTKPGVIRPVLVKGKSTLKKEEPYQPNPFKKYLEEISDQDTEQETALLHPLYPTKLFPSARPPLHPAYISLADYLTPRPFGCFPSILCNVQGSSYSPYSHNTLYNKVSATCVVTQHQVLKPKTV